MKEERICCFQERGNWLGRGNADNLSTLYNLKDYYNEWSIVLSAHQHRPRKIAAEVSANTTLAKY